MTVTEQYSFRELVNLISAEIFMYITLQLTKLAYVNWSVIATFSFTNEPNAVGCRKNCVKFRLSVIKPLCLETH